MRVPDANKNKGRVMSVYKSHLSRPLSGRFAIAIVSALRRLANNTVRFA